jgi:hypothetical protein
MALCDATMMAGVQLSEKLEALLLAACLRIAAANEGGLVPTPPTVEELIEFPGTSDRQPARPPSFIHAKSVPHPRSNAPVCLTAVVVHTIPRHLVSSSPGSFVRHVASMFRSGQGWNVAIPSLYAQAAL